MFPNPRTREPSNRRSGFTLIEVMVATAVMAIMVVMIGGLFQQASSSWDAGYIRAEGGMAVRAVVGALTRDVATAVDGRRFGLSDPVEVESSRVTMYRLASGSIGGNRDIVKVEYKSSGSGSNCKVTRQVGSGTPQPVYSGGQGSNGARFTFSAAVTNYNSYVSSTRRRKLSRPYEKDYLDETGNTTDSEFSGKAYWNVPYVKVRCALTRSGTFSGLTVRSLGRDGVENGKEGETARDDIIVR